MKKFLAMALALLFLLSSAYADNYCTREIDDYLEYVALTNYEGAHYIEIVDIFGLEELCSEDVVQQVFVVYDNELEEVRWEYKENRFSVYEANFILKSDNYNFNSEIEYISVIRG